MRRSLLAAALLAAVAAPSAGADTRFEATLAGHAILPAAAILMPPPQGAPPGFALSGRFTGPENRRADEPGSVPGATDAANGRRPTGLSLPFRGQPVQGFSGIKPAGYGSYWVLTDNGFGNKRNSPDSLLVFHRVRPDWRGGTVAVERTVFLSDPNRVVPFHIVTDPSPTRFLTGADLDIESIQPVGDSFWFGDEFGPYLVRADAEGRVTHFRETRMDGRTIRGPDHFALQIPASPAVPAAFEARRSGGFEGMAASPDGSRLYAMLEQPLYRQGTDQPEGRFLRVLEFDTRAADWTGRVLRYRMGEGSTAIGDFNMVDERRALVVERDNGEGDPGLACAEGRQPPACFPNPARFKRVYLIDLGEPDAEGFVRKLGHIDLLAIRDPEGVARQRGDRPEGAPRDRFAMPFFTIENVAAADADHIVVANDNNLPFSAGRHLTRADDNEFILLRAPELLRAR
jgi:hypothetical protein